MTTYYTIYQTTNEVTGKIYIGKHQTKKLDDGYIGSGKYLNNSINKHGIEKFTKKILYVFNNETDMNNKEKELVTEDFVKEDTNYNLCPGGKGGFGYIHANGLCDYAVVSKKGGLTPAKNPELASKNISNGVKIAWQNGKYNKVDWVEICKSKYKHHTIKTKQKISETKKNTGTNKQNSQYGTMWITNGKENKKIKKDDFIPIDYRKGRT
jgi:hypothetical protein